jgi:hypothetical protein
MAQVTAKLRTLAVMDADWTFEQLSEAESDYTQADPRPGTAATSSSYAKLDPAIVGAQEDGIVLAVLQSGYPEVGGGALGVGYYLNDGVETISDARGYQAPVFVSDWRDGPTGDLVVSDLSGLVSNGSTVWNPHTDTVSSAISGAGGTGVAAVFVPGTDRLLLITDDSSYYTDNLTSYTQFATTGPAAARATTPTYASGRFRAAFDGSGNLLYVGTDTSGDPTTDFYASDDGGASWTHIESINLAGANGLVWDISPHPNGWIALVKRDNVANDVRFIKLGSAFDVPTDQDTVEIGSGLTPDRVTVCCDSDGVVWVYITETGAAPSTTYVWYSTDEGASFTRTFDLWSQRGTVDLNEWGACPHPLGGVAAGLTPTGGSGLAQLGGWSGPGRESGNWAETAGGRVDVHWVAYTNDPTTLGFTKTGASTDTHVASGGTAPNNYMRVQSGAGAAQGYWATEVHTGGRTEFGAEWICRITDDGGTTAAAIASGIGVRMQCRVNGATQKTLILYMDEAGWRLWDEEAAAWEHIKVAITLTTRTHFRFSLSGGSTWQVQTRQDGSTKWTLTSGSGLTNAVPGTDGVTARFAHLTGVANTESHWWKFNARGVASTALQGTSNIGFSSINYPIPDIHDTARQRLAWLRLRGGPSYTGELYTMEPRYSYPLSATFPTREPSPDRVWRSTSVGSTITVAIDRSRDTDLGYSQAVALVVRNSGTRKVRLVGQASGVGSFTTLATLDLATGFTDLLYFKDHTNSNRIRPSTVFGVPAGARYIQRNELVGGHVVLDPDGSGAGPLRRRIIKNTAGWWNNYAADGEPGPVCNIYLDPDDMDGTEDNGGDIHIVWPSGVLILYRQQDATPYRYWGWEIPSTEESVFGSYHQIGTVALMGVVGLGKEFSDGYQWQNVPNVRVTEDSYGTQRRQQLGPTRRIATVSWDHQTDHAQLRTGGPDSNWVAPAETGGTTTPMVVQDDVWPQIRGAVLDAKGGELPVCLILKAAAAYGSETITDPSLFLYGYIDGEQGWEQSKGNEASGELGRPRQLRIVEAV